MGEMIMHSHQYVTLNNSDSLKQRRWVHKKKKLFTRYLTECKKQDLQDLATQ